MDDAIRITATKKGTPPSRTLLDREIGYNRDQKAFYIGADGFNVMLCRADDVGKEADKIDALPEDAELGDVVAAFNDLISALKAGKVMKTD